jgi:hypothetical protein
MFGARIKLSADITLADVATELHALGPLMVDLAAVL